MKKDDTVYLRHILDAIRQIQDYVQDVSAERFLHDRLLQVGRILQEMSEAGS